MSDLITEYAAALFTDTASFDYEQANAVLANLGARCQEFAVHSGASASATIEFIAEARYRHQIWQLDVPLRTARFGGEGAVAALIEDFHAIHEQLYEVRGDRAVIEIVNVRARVTCPLADAAHDTVTLTAEQPALPSRTIYFGEVGAVDAKIARLESLTPGATISGPGIIESSFTTIVLNPGATAERQRSGSIVIWPHGAVTEAAAQAETLTSIR